MSFATLDQLRRHLNIDPSRTGDDDILQELLDRATEFVCSWCNRDFIRTEYTDIIDSETKGRFLPLNNYPVQTVSTLKINGREIAYSMSPSIWGFTIREYGIKLIGWNFNKGDVVEVIYEAGLDVIPADLVHAVIEIAAVNYKERDRIGLNSKTVQVETISFNNDIPAEVKKILAQYKRVWSVR